MNDFAVKKPYALARPRGATYTQPDAYDGAELKRPPGVGPARFVAFELPSRVGNKLYYPNGDVRCVTD
jgi:hypothetical protein